MTGRNRPIVLKKSAVSSTTEKYAFEIEIFTLISGFRVHISRSSAQKRRFQRLAFGQSGRIDFFNTIGQLQTLEAAHPPLSRSIPRLAIAIPDRLMPGRAYSA
jgi:hypothetical protein